MLGLGRRPRQSGFLELSSVLLGPRDKLVFVFLLGGLHGVLGVVKDYQRIGLRAVLGLNFLTG